MDFKVIREIGKWIRKLDQLECDIKMYVIEERKFHSLQVSVVKELAIDEEEEFLDSRLRKLIQYKLEFLDYVNNFKSK